MAIPTSKTEENRDICNDCGRNPGPWDLYAWGDPPYVQKGKIFRAKHNIKFKSREGLFVIFGFHKNKYSKGIKTSLASVEYAP